MDKRRMGSFIAEERRRLGLTQEALGERIGISGKTLSRWETGVYLPGVEALELLSREFDVTVDEIIAGKRHATNNAVTIAENASDSEAPAGTEDGGESCRRGGRDPFTAGERLRYFKIKWLRDNIFENVCGAVTSLVLAYAAARCLDLTAPVVCFVSILIYVIVRRCEMMSYAEERAFSLKLRETETKEGQK